MKQRKIRWLGALLILAVATALSGCAVGPRSVESADSSIGRDGLDPRDAEFRETVGQYGGVYGEPKLNVWLTSLGRGLAAHCGRPDMSFTFTILDTGEVNAFSTPGGFIYVTRGLLTLADSEAEVAAALSHEMAHLVRGDQAERYRKSQTVEMDSVIAGLLYGERGGERASAALVFERARFSQEQEFRADEAGIGILSAAGYDPRAMASLLAALDRDLRTTGDTDASSVPLANATYVESHPLTAERVAAAGRIAGQFVTRTYRNGRESYLRTVDGMHYGAGAEQGFVRDHVFVHRRAGIMFRLPTGFTARSAESAFVATRRDGLALVLTSASPKTAATPFDYLTQVWARDLALQNSDPISVNGRPAAVASARVDSDRGPVDVRLAAIGWSPSLVYRLLVIAPVDAVAASKDCMATTLDSFGALSGSVAMRLRPPRLRVITARSRDTVPALLRRMASDYARDDLFRSLNRLAQNEALRPGRQYKLVE